MLNAVASLSFCPVESTSKPYRAAILLAGYTRDHDLSDAAFSRALDNAAQYYGADRQSTLAAFDNLSADEYFGTIPTSTVDGAPWA